MKLTGKVVIEFSPLEVERVLAVVMDEDAHEALRFLKDCLEKKLKNRLREHCVPVFEVSYNLRQKDSHGKADPEKQ